MAEEKSSCSQAQQSKPKILQAPDLVTFYATGARIVASEYDIRIYFSDQQVPPDRSGRPTAVEKVCVVMAPGYAKEFASDVYEDVVICEEGWKKGS